MKLEKTEKARDELYGSLRKLGRRERTLMILVDGKRTLKDIELILKEETRPLAEALIREGYLTGISLTPPKTLQQMPDFASTPRSAVAQPVNADTFNGKRSLATTRMFLFDICERMFARRAPEQAEAFRNAFRNARDRESMLAAAREMMEGIEQIAGPERADSISARIAMLLPVEL